MFGREEFYASIVRKNSRPYILALLQFFEEYRNGLANYTDVSGAVQTPSDQTEAILLARYNQQTVIRLCALYQTLNELMRFVLEFVSMSTLLGIPRPHPRLPSQSDRGLLR